MRAYALLALLLLAGACMASTVERRISVPPVLGETIGIDVREGDTLHYSFDVIDPSGACVEFSERPAFGAPINHGCVSGASNTRNIKDSGRYELVFGNKGTGAVAVDLEHSVASASQAAGGKAAAEPPSACAPVFALLALAVAFGTMR